jgi:hypothetical protein
MSNATAEITALAKVVVESDDIDWPTHVPVVDEIIEFREFLDDEEIYNIGGSGTSGGHAQILYVRIKHVDKIIEWLQDHDIPVQGYHTGESEKLNIRVEGDE